MTTAFLAVLLLVSTPAANAGGVPECLRGYGTKLRKILGKEDAEVLFQTIEAFSPQAQRGARALLDASQDGEGLLNTIFDTLERRYPPGHVANPFFASDEKVFEAIGELADQPGDSSLHSVLRALNVHDENAGVFRSQGAILDLYVAKQLPSRSGLKFQYPLVVGDGSRDRVPDMFEPRAGCPEACGGLPGRLHENKNWTHLNPDHVVNDPIPRETGGFIYGHAETALSGLADEFARDIVLLSQQGVGFDFYRLNFNSAVGSPAQREAIIKLLKKQFESTYVRNQVAAGRLDDLLREFDQNAAALVRFLP